jgi:hypothetical protein
MWCFVATSGSNPASQFYESSVAQAAMPHTKFIKFIVKPEEAIILENFKEFVFYRQCGPLAFNIPAGDMPPDFKAAMLRVSHFQVGQAFYVQESFRHIYDAEKNESSIMYKADEKFFRVNPIKGRLQYGANGTYVARLMEQKYCRCILVVKALDVVQIKVTHKIQYKQRWEVLKHWNWEITFTRVEIGEYGGY